MSSRKVPIAAIVGRANVGKSSLFNAIIKRREAIVANEPGTTRDAITAKAAWNDHDFWIVDTAGFKEAEDDFELTIQDQITEAADSADIILVVIEADADISEEDRRVATMALKSRKPVLLVINKADKINHENLGEYERLGIKDMFFTSVTQRRGINDLLDYLVSRLPKASIKESDDRIHVAVLGRPNVGKSQLFNTLAKKQQAIVADRAGTTRDVNRTVVKYEGREIELMDTAGIRRSGKIEKGVERFSVMRSLAAIEQADICLLLIDVNEPSVALDQKIAGLIKDAGKGLILVVSKWDSIDKSPFTRDEMAPRLKADYQFVPWAPLIFTSSVSGQNVTKIFEFVLQIASSRENTVKTTELNKWLRKIIDRHPPAGLKNRQPRLRYIVQEENTWPNFRVFGSQIKYLHWSYRRYMEREFRDEYDFEGTPIKFWFIEQHGENSTKDKG
jgi:GTP-binding protein